jgi:hypothetical protein
MQKTDLKISTQRAQIQIFSIQVRRFRVLARRLRGLEIPEGFAFFAEAPRCQKQQHEPGKNGSELDKNNSD